MSQPQIPLATWEDTAACRNAGGETMFPTHPDGRTINPRKHPAAYRAGLDLCATCDHHEPCADLWRQLGHPTAGIWFGTVPGERVLGARQCRCGRWFDPASNGQKHCGTECATRAHKEQRREWERRRRG